MTLDATEGLPTGPNCGRLSALNSTLYCYPAFVTVSVRLYKKLNQCRIRTHLWNTPYFGGKLADNNNREQDDTGEAKRMGEEMEINYG
jgi:hypothetical protein